MNKLLLKLSKFLAESYPSESKRILKLAGEKEFKYLAGVNLSTIKDRPGPDDDKRQFYIDLKQRAESGDGPYSSEQLEFIRSEPDQNFPQNNTKVYIKWVADNIFDYKLLNANDKSSIKDWFMGENPDIAGLSADEALSESEKWHNKLGESAEQSSVIPYETKKVIYEFPNGYTIVYIPAAGEIKPYPGYPETSYDRVLEGNKLSICLGDGNGAPLYQDNKDGMMYSLRDTSNYPHASIRVDANAVIEAKGNKNSIISSQYSDMVIAWLKNSKINYKNSIDIILASKDLDLLKAYIHKNRDNLKKLGELIINPAIPLNIAIDIKNKKINDLDIQGAYFYRKDIPEDELIKKIHYEGNNELGAKTVISYIVRRRKLSDKVLSALMQYKQIKYLFAFSRKEYISKDTFEMLAMDKDPDIRKTIARNENLPKDIFKLLAYDDNIKVRRVISRHKNLPEKLLKLLAMDKDMGVLLGILKRENYVHVASILAQSKNDIIRAKLAEKDQLPEYIIRMLAIDKNPAVRRVIADRDNLSEHVIGLFKNDKEIDIKKILLKNKHTDLYRRMQKYFNRA